MGAALPKPSFDAVDESRIDATLRDMSLDEKLGQMWQVDWRIMRPRPRSAGVGLLSRVIEMVVNLLPGCSSERPLRDEDVTDVTRLALGSVLGGGGAFPMPNTPEAWLEQADALQRAACATRMGVPLLIGNDTVHGQVHLKDATLFPHHIGLGCTVSACVRQSQSQSQSATRTHLERLTSLVPTPMAARRGAGRAASYARGARERSVRHQLGLRAVRRGAV